MLSPTCSARRGQPDVVSPTADQTGGPAAPAAADPSLDPLAGRDWAHCPRVHHPGAGSDGHAAGRRPRPSAANAAEVPSLDLLAWTRLGSLPVCSLPRRGIRRADRRQRPSAADADRGRAGRRPRPSAADADRARRRRPRPQTSPADADADLARRPRTSASVEAGGELTEQVLLALIEFVVGAGNIACC